MTYLMNGIARGKYKDCCLVQDMADHFGRTPSQFTPTLRKLVNTGHLILRGEIISWVYPTVAAIRQQDRQLSELDVKTIVARLQA